MSRSRPWSMEGRLVLLFTAGATLLLIAVSAILYASILGYLDRRMGAYLASAIEESAGDLKEPDGVGDVAAELAADLSVEPASWLRVLDANGKMAVETRGMSRRMPMGEFPPVRGSETIRRDYTDAGGRWISLAARRVNVRGTDFTIQVAVDRHADREFLLELRWMLGGLAATGILFSGAMASIVTRRGLRPLKDMEEAVARVRIPQLLEGLEERPWPRELIPLAVEFDTLLGRLSDAFARLSQFSADLAHELRTPLAILRGEAEVALTKGQTNDEYRRVLESSMEEYERLSSMTSRLLFLAHAEAEETELKLQEIDGRTVIDALLDFYRPYAEERQISIRAAGHGTLKADAILFRNALVNLVENALQFTQPSGHIKIEITAASQGAGISDNGPSTNPRTPADDCVSVTVTDTGCGIAPEHLPRLFDRFYQTDPARRKGGIGLGLALVKSIMDLHKGSVTIKSQPGLGTEVTLRFPL